MFCIRNAVVTMAGLLHRLHWEKKIVVVEIVKIIQAILVVVVAVALSTKYTNSTTMPEHALTPNQTSN